MTTLATTDAEQDNREERMAWWHDAKFGMFVHWGCYSVLGRGEQIIVRDLMPFAEYKECRRPVPAGLRLGGSDC